MNKWKLIAFDIDGTLTESKQELKSDMAELLARLMGKYKVAVISGAGMPQFEKQFLSHLTASPEQLQNLYLLPTDGTALCVYEGEWKCEYDPPFTPEEVFMVRSAIEESWKESGLPEPEKIYGEQIEERGAQISFSALGQTAPIEEKKVWDIDHKKREKVLAILKDKIPGFSAHIGGTTTIDINRGGIDKAYGLNKLLKYTGISREELLYVGDELEGEGNDSPALRVAGECRAVSGPEETKSLILSLL